MALSGRRLTIFGNYESHASTSMPLYDLLVMATAETAGFGQVTHRNPPAVFGRLPARNAWLKAMAGRIDKFAIAPALFPNADVLHIVDHANAVYIRPKRARLSIVTCHDLIPFLCLAGNLSGWRPSRAGEYVLNRIAGGLRDAGHVVCVSENTQADLVRLIGVPAERTSVIPNCVRPDFPRPARAEALAELARRGIAADTPFILSFGRSFYKNRFGALEMFARALPRLPGNTSFISIGPSDDLFTTTARRLGCADRMIVLPQVSLSQLSALYATAAVLLFPSYYEGFGWPIVEAQSFGLPVIASRVGPIPWIAGVSALLIDPFDAQEGAEALASLLNDPDLHARLAERGLKNVERFGFTAWRDAYHALYARLVS